MKSKALSRMKKFAIGTLMLGMAVMQPVSVLPDSSPLSTVVTAEAATAKTPGTTTLSKISSSAYNKITISWKKATNATHYVIYYRKNGTSKWTKLTTVAASKTSYTHTSSKKFPIVVGQKYNYTVRAYNSSSKKYGTYNKTGLTKSTVPGTVKLKKATLNSKKTAITVTWNKAAGCNYYRIYRKSTSSTTWKRIATVKSSVLSYTDKSPVKGEKNTYTVRAYYSPTKALGGFNKTGVSATLPAVKVTKVALNKTSATLTAKGQTVALTATASPSNATNKAVTWKSSNTKVATVSSTGKVTAVANGTATITATAKDGSGKKATCKVTVKIPAAVVKVTGVSLNKTSATLTAKGQTVALTATASPSNAANKAVTWKSSNTSVATVDSTGKVTAVANGTATITATAADGSGKNAGCQIAVNIPVPTPTLSPEERCSIELHTHSVTLKSKGSEAVLTTTRSYPSEMTNFYLTWTSSDTSVATVNSNGRVTAVSNGTCTITVQTPGGYSKDTCEVIVDIPPWNIENITLAGGKTAICSFHEEDVPGININDITFEVTGNIECIDYYEGYWNAQQTAQIQALKTGTVKIVGMYNGTVLKTWNITITSTWAQYAGYYNWKMGVEAQIWDSSMSVTEKLDVLKNYIKENFAYSGTAGYSRYYAWETPQIDCFGATDIFCDLAKDLGLTVGYVDYKTGTIYEYFSEAVSHSNGHMLSAVWMDGAWAYYDAQPPVYG